MHASMDGHGVWFFMVNLQAAGMPSVFTEGNMRAYGGDAVGTDAIGRDCRGTDMRCTRMVDARCRHDRPRRLASWDRST